MKSKYLPGAMASVGLLAALGSTSFGATTYTVGQTGSIIVDRIVTSSEIYGAASGFEISPGVYQSSLTDSTDGGEFTLITNGGVVGTPAGYTANTIVSDPNVANENGFESFCLETNVGFPDSTTNVLPTSPLNYKISNTVINNPSEILNLGTAYLYSNFAGGTLTGYNYTSTTPFFDGTLGETSLRAESAAELQAAIWYLEGQYGLTGTLFSSSTAYSDAGGANNAFLNLVQLNLGATSAAGASNGAYGVEVMNIGLTTTIPNYNDQAQLVIAPSKTNVPDGGFTVLLLGAAIGGYGMIRRKLSI